MGQVNKPTKTLKTHEGGTASHCNPEQQLRRSVMACMLWENEFYEDGESIAQRLAKTIAQVDPQQVFDIAVEARNQMYLRHAPLLIAREMARLPKHKALVSKLLPKIIQRADELTEFLSVYWKDKRQPVSAQVKKGLSKAFGQFNEYELAKYNRDKAVKLKDVLRICHAKPEDESKSALFKKVLTDTLATPDTWEVALSGGADKKETWLRLIAERKLGGLALLRNLRNMLQSQVPAAVVQQAILEMRTDRILPFRFVAAAKYAPQLEPVLETVMLKAAQTLPKLDGVTHLLVDVSGSMDCPLSSKSELMRLDAASALAMLIRETTNNARVFTFSNQLVEIAPRRGFALRDAILHSQPHGGTELGAAIRGLQSHVRSDRLIIVTDEQTADSIPAPQGKGYIINVASNKNGIGYGQWTKIDGWSEAILSYIAQAEAFDTKR